jgi:hypothetical protein
MDRSQDRRVHRAFRKKSGTAPQHLVGPRLFGHDSRLLVFGLFVSAGCAGDAGEPQRVIIRDSAGVRITESLSPAWRAGTEWKVSRAPDIIIGSTAVDSGDLVWDVTGAGQLSSGNIVILSGGARQIVRFHANGQYAGSIGRRGRGPGEFSYPQHLQIKRSDTLVVWDAMLGPITSFDTTGSILERREIDLGRVAAVAGPEVRKESITPLSDGTFVLHGYLHGHDGVNRRGLTRPPVLLLRITRDYAADTLGIYGGVEQMRMNVAGQVLPMLPLFPAQFSVAGGGAPLCIYVTNGDPDEIRVFDAAGLLVQIVRRRGAQLRVTNEEVQRAKQWIFTRNARSASGRMRWKQMLDALPEQRLYPPISSLIVDRGGYIWAQDKIAVADGLWSVFDPAGRWLGRVRVPLARIFDIGPDFIIGLARDSFDVERIQRHRLRRDVLSSVPSSRSSNRCS